MPKVSVFMAAYNAEAYISESIQSILNQTFKDFELLIVNDGSTDNTDRIVKSFKDPRIRLINNGANKGIPYTRNVALKEAKGELLAILDSDDISFPERLAIQVHYMDQEPQLAAIGSWAKIIDGLGKETGETLQVHTDPELIKTTLLFENTFVHSSVIIRTEVLRSVGGYPNHQVAQDYALFSLLSAQYKLRNIPQFLLKYRVHNNNISKTKSIKVAGELLKIKKKQLALMQVPTSIANPKILIDPLNVNFLEDYKKLYKTLIINNRHLKLYDQNTLEQVVFKKWYQLILKTKNRYSFALFFSLPLSSWKQITFNQINNFFKRR